MAGYGYDPEEHGPSPEVIADGLRRAGRKLGDLELDEQIAIAAARRDVHAAHGQHRAADVWANVMLAFHDVRRERLRLRQDFERVLSEGMGVATRDETPKRWPL